MTDNPYDPPRDNDALVDEPMEPSIIEDDRVSYPRKSVVLALVCGVLNFVAAVAVLCALPFQVGKPEGGDALTYIAGYLVICGPIFLLGVTFSLFSEKKREVCLALNAIYLAGWIAIVAMDTLFS